MSDRTSLTADAHKRNEEQAPKPGERFPYSAIIRRPKLKLPGGKKMIVWPVVNVEEWDVTRPMPRTVSPTPGGVAAGPDIHNWVWHEYGMRVGIWRLMEALRKQRITPTLSINAKVCETRPEIAQAALDAGWEFMAHCYEQMPIHKIDDQPAMIAKTVEVLKKFTGRTPSGWLGPGRGQTYATLDYIAAAGFKWFGDWVADDQPFWVATRNGPVVSMPYTVELNDIAIMLTGQHESDVMMNRAKDAFDTLYAESSGGARVLALAVHPYISGAAHRIKYFKTMLAYMRKHKDVVFWTGEQIYDWFKGQVQPS